MLGVASEERATSKRAKATVKANLVVVVVVVVIFFHSCDKPFVRHAEKCLLFVLFQLYKAGLL